jgi:hypothetical protein
MLSQGGGLKLTPAQAFELSLSSKQEFLYLCRSPEEHDSLYKSIEQVCPLSGSSRLFARC